jgi:hypothetical protein
MQNAKHEKYYESKTKLKGSLILIFDKIITEYLVCLCKRRSHQYICFYGPRVSSFDMNKTSLVGS